MKKSVVLILVFAFLINLFCPIAKAEFSVSAKAAIVIAADTLEVLYEKSANQKLPMASTTKIMTALLLAEQPDLSKTVKTTKQMVTVEGSSMGLLEGDTVSYRDLLYGMLLASGNDAANTTAYVLAGSTQGFAKMMNEKAAELGMKNTSFVTPSGLDDENHYTTAYDMALLTAAALKNSAFRTACSSKSAVLYYGNPPYRRTLTNHNKLLGNYEGIIGVKTGFTKKSGRCLVTAAEREGKRVIAVTLNDPDDWNDHRKLLDYGLEKTVVTEFKNDDVTDVLPIVCGTADLVRIKCEQAKICTAVGTENEIKRKIILPKFIYAPISAGEKVGEIEYYFKDTLVKTSDIFSVADVESYNRKENFQKRFLNNLKVLWNNF